MRLLVFAPDTPFPPNRGGRADIWRRIQAVRKLGHQVMVVHLHEPTGPLAPSPADLATMDEALEGRFGFPIKRGSWRTVRQLATSWWVPWHAATRLPAPEEMSRLNAALDTFVPELMWLDGPWFGPLAERFARDKGLSWVYRSHNIEHQYIRKQALAAERLRDRVAWRLAAIGLKRLEQRLMQQARAVFDISLDDMAYWQGMGIRHCHWLPPLPESAMWEQAPKEVPGEVVFVGNLRTPNNVRGIQFLTAEVWPLVRNNLPRARLAIVGSNPTPYARACVERCEGAELRENVEQPMAHMLGARLLVNPVMTGSGVQLKMLDMLMTDVPIVTASQGLRGLPPETSQSVFVADDAATFAQAIVNGLGRPSDAQALARRAALRRSFTAAGLAHALETAGVMPAQHG